MLNFSEQFKIKHTVEVIIPKTIDLVYEFITTRVNDFWPEDFEGQCSKMGDEFVLKSGNTHFSKNKIIEIEHNKKVVWLVTESKRSDGFDWSGTKMIFELFNIDSKTSLQFTYDGVILQNEYDRLIQICSLVIKDLLYKNIMKTK